MRAEPGDQEEEREYAGTLARRCEGCSGLAEGSRHSADTIQYETEQAFDAIRPEPLRGRAPDATCTSAKRPSVSQSESGSAREPRGGPPHLGSTRQVLDELDLQGPDRLLAELLLIEIQHGPSEGMRRAFQQAREDRHAVLEAELASARTALTAVQQLQKENQVFRWLLSHVYDDLDDEDIERSYWEMLAERERRALSSLPPSTEELRWQREFAGRSRGSAKLACGSSPSLPGTFETSPQAYSLSPGA
jgi:hypothetical protein